MKSTEQQLECRGWHLVKRQEELLTEEGEEMGDKGAEGSSATGDGGQAAISLTPDVVGTGFGSLLNSIRSTLLKKKTIQ